MKKELRRRFGSNRVLTDYSGALKESFTAIPEMAKVLNVVSESVTAVSMDASQVVTGVDYNHVSDATVERVMNTYENLKTIVEGENNGRKRLIDYSLLMYQIGNKLQDERVLKILFDNGVLDNVEISNIKALSMDPTKPLTQMGIYLAMMTDLTAVLLKIFTADPTSNFDGVTLASQLMNDLARFTEKEQIETAQLNTLFNAGVIDDAAMEVSRRNINTSILDPNGYDVYGNPLSHTATTYTGQTFTPNGNVAHNTYNPNTGYFTNNVSNQAQVQPVQQQSGLLQAVNGYSGFETGAATNNQVTTVTSYGAVQQQPQVQQQVQQQVQTQQVYQQPVQNTGAVYQPVMNTGQAPIQAGVYPNPVYQQQVQPVLREEIVYDNVGNTYRKQVDQYGNTIHMDLINSPSMHQQAVYQPVQNGLTPQQKRNLYRTDLLKPQVQQQVQQQVQTQQVYQQPVYQQAVQPVQQQSGGVVYQQQSPQYRIIQEFDNNEGYHVTILEDVGTGMVSIERTPIATRPIYQQDSAVISAAAIYS